MHRYAIIPLSLYFLLLWNLSAILDLSTAERLHEMEDRMNTTERKVQKLELDVGGTLPTGTFIHYITYITTYIIII